MITGSLLLPMKEHCWMSTWPPDASWTSTSKESIEKMLARTWESTQMILTMTFLKTDRECSHCTVHLMTKHRLEEPEGFRGEAMEFGQGWAAFKRKKTVYWMITVLILLAMTLSFHLRPVYKEHPRLESCPLMIWAWESQTHPPVVSFNVYRSQ